MSTKDSIEPDGKIQPEQQISRIANILGCSPAAFTSPASSETPIGGAAELLYAWVEMDDARRRDLLEFARSLARHEPFRVV